MKILFFILSLSLPHSAWSLTGLSIIKEVDGRNQGKNSQSLMTMTLQKRGKKEVRELVWWSQRNSSQAKHLIKFRTPKPLLNTGLLIHAPKKSDNKIWLYLSKAKKKEPRKIAAEKRGQSFLGSQFSYVDFEERDVNEFNHKIIKCSPVKGFDTHCVQSEPKDKTYTYSSTTTWVDKTSKVPVKVEMNIKGKLAKRYTVTSLKKVEGIWTIMSSNMKDLRKNKTTELVIKKIKYNLPQSTDNYSFSRLTAEL